MSKVTIDVSGTHSVSLPPERGTVHASVALEGPQAPAVFERLTTTLQQVRTGIETLHDPDAGPITWFAIHQVASGSYHPYGDRGPLPLVHTAAARLKVEFTDFAALGRWLAANAALDGFTVGGIEWDLAKEHREAVHREVRQQAVLNAQAHAQDYADALDLGPVRITHVSDRADAGFEPPHLMAMKSMGAYDSVESGPDLTPEDVEISASVTAQFVVDAAP